MAEIESAIEFYNIMGRVQEELAARGISVLPKPSFTKESGVSLTEDGEPIIPEDITMLTLSQIGTLSSMCNAYLSFLGTQVALSDMECSTHEEIMEFIWAQARSEAEGRKGDKDDYARLDMRFVRANADFKKYKTIYEIAKIKYKQFETNLRLLSREIARRGLEVEHERIGNNMDKRPIVGYTTNSGFRKGF